MLPSRYSQEVQGEPSRGRRGSHGRMTLAALDRRLGLEPSPEVEPRSPRLPLPTTKHRLKQTVNELDAAFGLAPVALETVETKTGRERLIGDVDAELAAVFGLDSIHKHLHAPGRNPTGSGTQRTHTFKKTSPLTSHDAVSSNERPGAGTGSKAVTNNQTVLRSPPARSHKPLPAAAEDAEMDVDMPAASPRATLPPSQQKPKAALPPPGAAPSTAFIIDTNFVMSHLDIVDLLRILAPQYHHVVVVPQMVLRELDGLKTSTRRSDEPGGATVGTVARTANRWITNMLGELDPGVRGQRLKERTDLHLHGDDAILDCGLYFQKKWGAGCVVVMLLNDRNLCARALADGVLTVSWRPGMTAEQIAERLFAQWQDRQQAQREHSPVRTPYDLLFSEMLLVLEEAVGSSLASVYGGALATTRWHTVVHENKPTTRTEAVAFVTRWGEVLATLYQHRDPQQQHSLQVLMHRWQQLASA